MERKIKQRNKKKNYTDESDERHLNMRELNPSKITERSLKLCLKFLNSFWLSLHDSIFFYRVLFSFRFLFLFYFSYLRSTLLNASEIAPWQKEF